MQPLSYQFCTGFIRLYTPLLPAPSILILHRPFWSAHLLLNYLPFSA